MSGLLAKSLREQRRGVMGWSIGIALTAAMYAVFYPSVRKSASSLTKYIQSIPDALKTVIGVNFTTPAGYLRSEVFSTIGPVLFLVWGIGAGARAIAGEEEAGTLDLLLSTPVTRRHVVLDKAAGIMAAAAALAILLFVTLAILGPPFQLRVPLADVAAASAMLFTLAVGFAMVSLAAGCAGGHKGAAEAVAGGFALVAYLLNALGPSVSALSPLRPLSPFRWYLDPDPLQTGLHATNVAILAGVAVVGLAVALMVFERRDLAA